MSSGANRRRISIRPRDVAALRRRRSALMLTACAVGPDFQHAGASARRRVYFPARIAADRPISPATGGSGFARPQLNRLIDDGIAYNTDLQAAEAAVRVAQANALAQRASLFPDVQRRLRRQPPAGADRDARQRTPRSGADIYSLHTAQVSVAFVPDVLGGTRRPIESAEAQAEAQAFQREAIYRHAVVQHRARGDPGRHRCAGRSPRRGG